MGPAIVVDIAKPIAEHDDAQMGIRNAVIAYVLPQLEGREPKKVAADISSLATASGAASSTAEAWAGVAGVLIGMQPSVAAPSAYQEQAIDITE